MKTPSPPKLPVALRRVEANLTYTTDAAWAWFVLPTQRWAFRSDGQRMAMTTAFATRLALLSGHQVHLRVTSRPYAAASWARGLDQRTPAPLGGKGPGKPFMAFLEAQQRHMRGATADEKAVYLGVRLTTRRSALAGAAERFGLGGVGKDARALRREASLLAEIVAGDGFSGRPASTREVEWLLHRSLGLGLPSPGRTSIAGDVPWETEDLPEILDRVTVGCPSFGKTVRVARVDDGGVEHARHVAVLTVGRVEDVEAADPAKDPWLAVINRFPFPVELSVRLNLLDGEAARQSVQKKLLVIRDMQRHHAEHDLDEPLALERQAAQARVIEDQMVSGQDAGSSRGHGWYRVAVSGRTEEEALERARRVTDALRQYRVTLAHPTGVGGGVAQLALVREFMPGEPVASSAYQRRSPVLFTAAGMPTVASALGDQRGPYIGHTVGSMRRGVMFDTHYATETQEKSGLVPIVGELGAGKSVLMGLIAYGAVQRGIHTVLLDPSGPMANLCHLPEFAGHAQHVDLTQAAPGTLSPFGVVADPLEASYPDANAFAEARVLATQERKLLAIDVLTMLLPAGLAERYETRLMLQTAIRQTEGKATTSLWTVVEILERSGDEQGQIAAYLRDMAAMPMARLFFPGSQEHFGGALSMAPTLTVLTMAGLVLPPPGIDRVHWSTSEQMAVPLLHLASWYATKAIYGRPRHERKLCSLDEVHFLNGWGAGRSLFNRLGRDSRKWNACVLAASQNPGDILGMDVANLISGAFVGRIEDEATARDALRMLRVPTGIGYEATLGTLSPRGGRGQRSGLREFVMRDADDNVDRMRVDLDHVPHVLAALDTTAVTPLVEEVSA